MEISTHKIEPVISLPIFCLFYLIGLSIGNQVQVGLQLLPYIFTLILIGFWYHNQRSVVLAVTAGVAIMLGIIYPTLSVKLISSITSYMVPITRSGDIIRDYFEHLLDSTLPYPQSIFSTGLIFGSDRGTPFELKQMFAKTGTLHILAASGYNLTIIINLFASWLRGLGRTIALLASLILVILFTAIAGFQISIVRAAIMAIIVLIVRYRYGYPYQWNILLFTASIICTFDPTAVASLSFQLTFISLIGLMTFSHMFAHLVDLALTRYRIKFIPRFLISIFTECFGAQLAVTPLLLYYFGNYSLISLPMNLIVLPLIPISMLIIIALISLSWFVGISNLLAFLVTKITTFILTVESYGAKLPFNQVNWTITNWWSLLVSYLILGSLYGLYMINSLESRRVWRSRVL